ncbi:MAG TPA: glycosyltransferase family 4 protein [Thermoanaerobaculia bacterium]|jgi:glycosyltransferase involved in cell wall biosynthesis|nr:glycosyltransferase family 4 protein [Thermoanaerobaculia bacterium]
MADDTSIRRVAMLGNHLPRQCGIATFTTHLSEAIANAAPDLDCFVLAMNDGLHKHAYPGRVRFELSDSDTGAYTRAADFLNINAVDVLSVQHEYGIFGGKAGGHLLTLLRELRMPIVTTLHTILTAPNPHQRRVMDELTAISDRLVVMTNGSADILREVHGVSANKIDMIPHGIPSVPFSGSKDRLGVEGRPLILTFGLLGPDKGIEHVIDALPTILSHYPDAVYIVLGATHPHIVERHGETYRLMLEERAKQLGVDGNVIFHNRFVSQAELCEFLAAADIYITPYLNPEQITSGTLAYALGAGKAVVSTPYAYAKELLADGRGILVPWRDSSAIAKEIVGLLDDPEKRLNLRLRAAEHGQSMLWPAVAQSYLQSFESARVEHAQRLRTAFRARTLATRPAELPQLNLEHVAVMTDDTGILQHATFNVPRYDEGYCVDDNARALMLMTLLEDAGSYDPKLVRNLSSRYLAFVSNAFNAPLGRFRNFMSHSRVWREEQGSEDSHGRALWALGTVVGCSADPGRHSLAGALFHAALPAVSAFSSPRAWAFALLGIEQYLHAFEGDRNVQASGRAIAERLLGLFKRTDHPEWPWFENSVTYCNARLPQALIATASWTGDAEMSATGLRSLEWLTTIQRTAEGYFAPVGTNGFFQRGGEAAIFDQQPVDACATVSACMHAFRTTGDQRWADQARRAFTWFLGQNQLHQALYDPLSGGCRDALHPDRLNENQGAESTLSFLLALMDMRAFEMRRANVASEVLVAVSA